ncbi:MAG: hypothetical protein ACKO8Q_01570, partial [Bacteroidota bacterium]
MSKQNFQHKDFNQISSDFQELFPDASFHVVGDYSFLKLAQHAHSFSQIKAQHKKGSFEFKWWKLKLKSKIKNCKAIQIPNFTASEVEMLIQPKRIDTVNGMKESVITKRLLEVELVNVQVWDLTGEYSCADVVFNPSLNWIFELDESVQKMHVLLCNWLYKIEGVVQKADCSYYHAAASVFLRD